MNTQLMKKSFKKPLRLSEKRFIQETVLIPVTTVKVGDKVRIHKRFYSVSRIENKDDGWITLVFTFFESTLMCDCHIKMRLMISDTIRIK